LLIRPIETDDDVALAGALLTEGFPQKPAAIWPTFLQRLRALGSNTPTGVPIGYLMTDGGRGVGVLITPAANRERSDGTQGVVVNLSSWYVVASERWRAARMLQTVLKRHEAMFTDLTPTQDVQAMLPTFGFQPVNSGIMVTALPVAAALPAGGARVRALKCYEPWLAEALRAVLDAHEAVGCLSAVLEVDGVFLPLLFRKRSVKGAPAAVLIYCSDLQRFQSAMPAVARFLMLRGAAVLISDDTGLPARAGQLRRKHGLKFIRPGAGLAPLPHTADHTASELALLDF
jgi:hypothetical protein